MDLITKSDKNVIFVGSVGAGKTTLVNKICVTNFETSISGFSKIRDVQFAKSIRKNGCIAIDFPDFDSAQNQLIQYKIHQATLSKIPVRMICFVIKFTNRYDELLRDVNNLRDIFEDYIDNVVVIITHSEPIWINIRSRMEIEKIIEIKCNII